MRGCAGGLLLALLAVVVVVASEEQALEWGPSWMAQRPSRVLPKDLGPVVASSPNPQTGKHMASLTLSYDDYHRIKMRPLLHLEPAGAKEHSPQLFLFGAFLDTRPLYYRQPAVLRMMAMKYEPGQDSSKPDLYCKYLVEGDDRYYLSKAHGPLRVDKSDFEYRDVIYTCNTGVTSVEAIEKVAGSWTGHNFFGEINTTVPNMMVPRWATLVAAGEQHVFDLAWVHVVGMPLVHKDASAVNRVFQTGSGSDTQTPHAASPPGPYMTPDQYHAGEGEMAVCAGPIYGGNHHAGVVGEWAEFQSMMGVSKIFLYDYDMGPLTRSVIQAYQAEGLIEVFDVWFSKRLLKPGAQQDTEYCKHMFSADDKRRGHMGAEWVSGCSGSSWDGNMRVFLHAESAFRQHCIYNAAGRYRWVAVIDLDEWLVPRLSPPTTWSGLFKLAMDDAQSNFSRFGFNYTPSKARFPNEFHNTLDRAKSPFPSSFMFLNTYVCAHCSASRHLAPNNVSVDPATEVTVPPRPDLPPGLRIPRTSLAPITWSVVRAEVMGEWDRTKCISDPLAVMTHYAHNPWAYWEMEGGSLKIPTTPFFLLAEEVALLYHVRVGSQTQGRVVFGAAGSVQTLSLTKCFKAQCFPWGKRSEHLFEDWTVTNLFGEELVARLGRRFEGTHFTDMLPARG